MHSFEQPHPDIEPDPFVPYQPPILDTDENLTHSQHEHLKMVIAHHIRRTQESKRLAVEYRKVLADDRLAAGFSLLTKEITYPIVVSSSKGAKIWDVDGNEYIDVTMGFGVHLFGHSPPFIASALMEQIQKGIHLGPQSMLAAQVAWRICEMTHMQRVIFTNTGTEAVMVALRLARAVTGKRKIALFSGAYHGHFDGVLAVAKEADGIATPMAPGISPHIANDVIVLDRSDPFVLQTLNASLHELAAVLVEPVHSRRPDIQDGAFLQALREITEKKGTVLIFDEIITGFRVHTGGAQAWFGVQADLATYGKVVGGGLPVGVVAGDSSIIDAMDGGQWNFGDASYPQVTQSFAGGTFDKHPLSMAAALSVLEYLKSTAPTLLSSLNERTALFSLEINDYLMKNRIKVRLAHFGSLFRFIFPHGTKLISDIFFCHLLDRGVYVWEGRNCFFSTAHTRADIDQVIQVVVEAFDEMRKGDFLAEITY